jgi:hypothetical protein
MSKPVNPNEQGVWSTDWHQTARTINGGAIYSNGAGESVLVHRRNMPWVTAAIQRGIERGA